MFIPTLIFKLALSCALGFFSLALWHSSPASWICGEGSPVDSQRPFVFQNKAETAALFSCVFFLAFLPRSSGECILLCPVLTALLQLSLSDIFYRILQDEWEIFIALLGVLRVLSDSKTAQTFVPALSRRLAAALLFILLWLLCAVIAGALKSDIPLGFGDAKLLAACCILLGAGKTLRSAALAFILAGIYAGLLLTFKKTRKKDRIAFGPFICLGILYSLESWGRFC